MSWSGDPGIAFIEKGHVSLLLFSGQKEVGGLDRFVGRCFKTKSPVHLIVPLWILPIWLPLETSACFTVGANEEEPLFGERDCLDLRLESPKSNVCSPRR